MPSRPRILGVAAVACGAAALAAAILQRMHAAAARADAERVRGQAGPAAAVDLERRLAGLPQPVVRYLRLALGEVPQAPAAVEMVQAGRLRTAPDAARWMEFTALHTAAPRGCAFQWNARVRLAPLLHVRVLDALLQGRGSGQVLLQSALRVGADGGTPEMDSGALHRFLAEAVWYPWALLPSDRLRWEPLDAQRALAILTCRGTTVALEFRFASSGEVSGIHAQARWGSFQGGYRQVPWEGHFSDYVREQGVLIPRRGEVGWYRDGVLELVWQGAVRSYRMLPVR